MIGAAFVNAIRARTARRASHPYDQGDAAAEETGQEIPGVETESEKVRGLLFRHDGECVGFCKSAIG